MWRKRMQGGLFNFDNNWIWIVRKGRCKKYFVHSLYIHWLSTESEEQTQGNSTLNREKKTPAAHNWGVARRETRLKSFNLTTAVQQQLLFGSITLSKGRKGRKGGNQQTPALTSFTGQVGALVIFCKMSVLAEVSGLGTVTMIASRRGLWRHFKDRKHEENWGSKEAT